MNGKRGVIRYLVGKVWAFWRVRACYLRFGAVGAARTGAFLRQVFPSPRKFALFAGLSICAWLLAFGPSALAQTYDIPWSTIDGGGADGSSTTYALSGTAGQPDAQFGSSATYTLAGGFWVTNAPVLASIEGTALSYTENGSPLGMTSTLTVSDVDSATLSGATVSITSGYVSAEDLLAFTNDGSTMGNIAVASNTGGVLSLTSSGTSAAVAQWQAALRSVTYSNSSDAPNTTSRTISFVVNDGTDNSNATTKTVSLTAVNDAPVLADANLVLSAQNEDIGGPSGAVGTLVSSLVEIGGNVTDPDSGAVTGIAVIGKITTNGDWYYSTDNGANWSGIVGVSTTSAKLLAADSNTRVFFWSNSQFNGTIAGGLTFRAWDQTTGSNGGTADPSVNGGSTAFSTATDTASITVNSVNDAPTGGSNSVTTNEDIAYTFTAANFAFTDPIEGNAFLAVKITTLPGQGTLKNNGSTFTAGTFVSKTDIDAGLLTFQPAANANGSPYTTFTFQVQDNGGTANGGIDLDPTPKTMTIDVTAVNDAPVNSVLGVTTPAQITPSFVTKFGSQGNGDGQFVNPIGIATDASGNLYITDASNARIQKLSSSGAFLAKWGSFGNLDGQFNFPEGIAVAASGDVYVADTVNHRIQKFTSSGTFVAKWGSLGTGDGQFDHPVGIAVDGAGFVYVADASNGRVQKFTSSGAFVTQWGAGSAPWGLALDASGNVYVTESLNQRVRKFTGDGVQLTQWGSAGTGNGQFSDPRGVSVDVSGNVYVVDLANLDRIQKFTSDGAFLTSFGSSGSGDGEFLAPHGIAVDGSGNVYVTDHDLHKILKFSPNSTVQATTSEETGLILSGGNGISVSDVDAGSTTVQLSLSVLHGGLTLNGTAGLSFGFGDGNGTGSGDGTADANITFRGSLTDINNALSGLSYSPASNYSGSDTLTVTSNDLGNTGSGGAQSDTDSLTINVTAANDAPVLANIEGSTLGFIEGAAATAITSTLTVTDVDNANLTGATIQITGNYANGEDVLGFSTIVSTSGTITGSFNAANGTMTLSGTDTLANYQAALRTVTYQNTSSTPGVLTRTVSFQVNDGSGANNLSNVATRGISVTAGNNAPTVSAPVSFTVTEDVAGNLTYTGTPFADPDSASLTVTLSAADGTITGNSGTGITVGGTATARTFAGTIGDLNTYFTTAGKITYQGATHNTANRTLTTAVSDGSLSSSAISTITFTALNDAPAGTDNTITINEDTPYPFAAADFGFSDANDSPANGLLAVKITTLPSAGTLTVNGATVSAGDFVSPDDIAAGTTWTARESNRYWTSVASSADGTKLVAIVGGGVGGGQIYTSTDSGVNWTARSGSLAWSAVASSSDGTKLVAAEFGGKLYTSTDSGVNWTARMTDANRNWTSLASSSDGTKLVAVGYGIPIHTSTDSGVTWTARESSPAPNWTRIASSSDGNKLVAVANGSRIYTSADSGVTWTARMTDANRDWRSVASSSDGTKLVAGVGSPGNGQIYISTDSGVTWTARMTDANRDWNSIASSSDGTKLVATVNGGQIYTSTGVPGLVFTPAANANGSPYTTFTFQVQDNGGTANGGVDLDQSPNAMTVNVTAANDAPVLADANVVLNSVNEDAGAPSGPVGTAITSLVQAGTGLNNVSDPDSGAATGLAITAADTANGSWHYSLNNGTAWSLLGTVSPTSALLLAADASTRIYFQPGANFNGSIANAITFRAWDTTSGSNGSTADASVNGNATAFSTATDLAAITVTAVNDAPTVTGSNPTPQVVSFSSAGSANWTVPAGVTSVEVLVVGGGGAGGGGGGGQVISSSSVSVTPGQTASITVGAGGARGSVYSEYGHKGGDSSFAIGTTTLAAVGGSGGAGRGQAYAGGVGFNGGGGSFDFSAATSFSGGNAGGASVGGGTGVNGNGGGGGAGGAGVAGTNSKAGDGGVGISSSISGTLTYYGGGGGGSFYSSASSSVQGLGVNGGGNGGYNGVLGTDGVNGLGGGGGGGPTSTSTVNNGVGGSGVVIIRYSPAATFSVTEDAPGNLVYTGTPFADGDGGSLTVTLTVSDGTITGNAGTGITIGGTATTRTFAGAVSDLNAYFTTAGKITYQGSSNNNANRTLTTTVSDGSLSSAATATISITPVNDAPVNTVPGILTGAEDTPLAFTGVNQITVQDVDGNVTKTQLSVSHGALTVNLAGGATMGAGANGTPTLTVVGTQAQVNAALATLSYQPASNFNGNDALAILSSNDLNGPAFGVGAEYGPVAGFTYSADPILGDDRTPDKAFDGTGTESHSAGFSPSATNPFYFKITAPNPILVTNYYLSGRSLNDHKPSRWTFEGSNDDSTWTILDSQSGVDLTSGKIVTSAMSSFVVSNSSPFKYYRLAITATTGSYIVIGEMALVLQQA